MSIQNKKRSLGIILAGWLLIIYFIYSLLYPLITTIILGMAELSGIRGPGSVGPVGSFSLLKHLGVPMVLLYFHLIVFFVITTIVPICSLIGGILVLKLKESGRKFVIILFSSDFVLRTVILFIGLIDTRIGNMYMANLSTTMLFYMFSLFDILIIYFFTRLKIKEQFLHSKV